MRILADRERIERYKKEQVTFNDEVCDFQYCDAAKESRTSELMLFAVKYGAPETAMEEVSGKNCVADRNRTERNTLAKNNLCRMYE